MSRYRDDDALQGRGASWNPENRFTGIRCERDADSQCEDESAPRPGTEYVEEDAASILSRNDSPDVGYEHSLNPYRGCEHGCIYCYARPMHEYAGYSAGLDFETKIFVKRNAPELLRSALSSPKWTPQVIALSGSTDPYQPVERTLCITRGCLGVFVEFLNPVSITTKNRLVLRDLDLLAALAAHQAVSVCVSITTLDLALNRVLEPRTSSPKQRLETIRALADAGIPVGVLAAPIIPALTDHEMPAILRAAADAGARFAGYIMLRLPHAVAPLFERWLEQRFPDRKARVLNRLRDLHNGKLYDASFETRMSGSGLFAEHVARLFAVAARRTGLDSDAPRLSTTHFQRSGQMDLL